MSENSDTVTLNFIGKRQRDFTVGSPTDAERTYYVAIGQPIHVTPEDAAALVARDPLLWTLDKGEPGGTPEEPPAERPRKKG